MTLVASTQAHGLPRGRRRRAQFWLNLLDAVPRLWRHRIAVRRELLRVSPRDLLDAGISPSQAAFEAKQPFWRPLIRLRDI